MNRLAFCSGNAWRGREAAVTPHFRARLGEAERSRVPVCCLSPSASALRASGSPAGEEGKLLVELPGNAFSVSERPVDASGVGLQQ